MVSPKETAVLPDINQPRSWRALGAGRGRTRIGGCPDGGGLLRSKAPAAEVGDHRLNQIIALRRTGILDDGCAADVSRSVKSFCPHSDRSARSTVTGALASGTLPASSTWTVSVSWVPTACGAPSLIN